MGKEIRHASVVFFLGVLILSIACNGQTNAKNPQAPIKTNAKSANGARSKRGIENFMTYQKWVEQDVAYIITNSERAAFLKLTTDEERMKFMEQFWLRRDPTPDTAKNESKEEHYRRIAYSNEYFGTSVPGWKSDRGRIYIVWGRPDAIKKNNCNENAARPPEERRRNGDLLSP